MAPHDIEEFVDEVGAGEVGSASVRERGNGVRGAGDDQCDDAVRAGPVRQAVGPVGHAGIDDDEVEIDGVHRHCRFAGGPHPMNEIAVLCEDLLQSDLVSSAVLDDQYGLHRTPP